MMSTFTAAAIQSAFEPISLDLHVSIQRASYLTSLVIAVLGGAPLFWRPLSDRYGRRPIFLVSLICSLVGNVGCAKSPTYATMALCRAITAFCISPAAAIGSGVVSETFFKWERARYMGIWTVMVTLGVPTAPFIMGFVALRVGYRWIYWILACVSTPPHCTVSCQTNSNSRRMQSNSSSTSSLARRLVTFEGKSNLSPRPSSDAISTFAASTLLHYRCGTSFNPCAGSFTRASSYRQHHTLWSFS